MCNPPHPCPILLHDAANGLTGRQQTFPPLSCAVIANSAFSANTCGRSRAANKGPSALTGCTAPAAAGQSNMHIMLCDPIRSGRGNETIWLPLSTNEEERERRKRDLAPNANRVFD